jgi:hypothetical protein
MATGYTLHTFSTVGTSSLKLNALNVMLTGTISGSGSMVNNASGGKISLMSANAYTGTTTVSGGTLGIYDMLAISPGTLIAENNTTLMLGRTITGLTNNITLNGAVTVAFDNKIDYLLVGGGGGGAGDGGGGGGGGAIASQTGVDVGSAVSLTATVGGGGNFGAWSTGAVPTAGGNSILTFGSSTITATGGSGGVNGPNQAGGAGGSGNQSTSNGAAGGAGTSSTTGLAGGTGPTSNITGTLRNYGGGGGGGVYFANSGVYTGGVGGAGGGGAGTSMANDVPTAYAAAGTPNTGGGGGAGTASYLATTAGDGTGYRTPGALGGTGLVVVRYLGGDAAAGGTETTGTGTAVGYTLHTFTTAGANTLTLNPLAATFSGTIGGTGSFVANPSAGGEFTFTQNNTYSGGTTLSAGTLKVGTGGGTGTLGLPTATGTVTNNGALIFNHTNNVSYAAPFAGTGTLSIIAAGGLTLTGAATYTGLTTVTSSAITYTNNTIPSTSGFAGAGFVTIQPAIGGTYASAYTANYTFANTLTGLTWGHSTNTANITLNTAIGIAGPISVYGGAITVNQNLNTSTAATASAVMLKGRGNISLASGKSITTNGGAVTLWSDSDGSGTGYVQMLANSSVSSGGAAITLGGGTDITTGYAVGEATRDEVTDGANIYYISGVNLQSGTSLTSSGGDVTLRGQNSGGSATALSFGVMGGGVTIDSGIGKISITGKATGSAGINAQAISHYGLGYTLRSANTTSQAISFVGDASGVNGTNSSLGINFSGSIEATGAGGGISISGTSGTATGVDVATNLSGNILAASGPINIVGINSSAQQGINFGTATVGFKAGTNVLTSSSTVTLKADGIGYGTTAINTTGTVGIYSLDSSASFGSAQTLPSTFTLDSGVTGLTIGKTTNAATVTLNNSVNINGPITIDAGPLVLNSSLRSQALNAEITLRAKTHITNTTATTTLTTNGGNILLASNVDDATDAESTVNGGMRFDYGITATSNGGNITLGGGNTTGSGYALGQNASGYYHGIRINGVANFNSGNGNIVMRGKSYSGAVANGEAGWGIGFWALTGSGGTIDSGTGTVYLDGFSQTAGSAYGSGVFFYTNNPFTIKSANTTVDAVKIIGKATGASGESWGMEQEDSTVSVLATGANGGITLNTSQKGSYEAVMRGTWNMLATSGPITWTGKADADGLSDGYWYGPSSFWGSKSGSLVTASTSNISIATDRFNWASGTNPSFATTGTVEVKPASTSFGMDTYSGWFVLNQNSQNVSGFTLGKSGNNATTQILAQPFLFTALEKLQPLRQPRCKPWQAIFHCYPALRVARQAASC